MDKDYSLIQITEIYALFHESFFFFFFEWM